MAIQLSARACLGNQDEKPAVMQEPDEGLQAVFLANRQALLRFLEARGAQGEAEDVLHEVWLKLERSAPGPVASPMSYLYRIANTVMIDRFRSARQAQLRDAAWSDANGVPEGGVSDAPSAERLVAGRQMAEQVDAALDRLDDPRALLLGDISRDVDRLVPVLVQDPGELFTVPLRVHEDQSPVRLFDVHETQEQLKLLVARHMIEPLVDLLHDELLAQRGAVRALQMLVELLVELHVAVGGDVEHAVATAVALGSQEPVVRPNTSNDPAAASLLMSPQRAATSLLATEPARPALETPRSSEPVDARASLAQASQVNTAASAGGRIRSTMATGRGGGSSVRKFGR